MSDRRATQRPVATNTGHITDVYGAALPDTMDVTRCVHAAETTVRFLPYPRAGTTSRATETTLHFTSSSDDAAAIDIERAWWHATCERRRVLARVFATGLVSSENWERAPTLVDQYVATLTERVERWHVAAAAAVDAVVPHYTRAPILSFAWTSMCDAVPYVSSSFRYELAMANVLGAVVHFNRAMAVRATRIADWARRVRFADIDTDVDAFVDSGVVPLWDGAPDALARRMGTWGVEDAAARRAQLAEFVAVRERVATARRHLEVWSAPLDTGVRYPPECARGSSSMLETLDRLTHFWLQHLRVETSAAGAFVYTCSRDAHDVVRRRHTELTTDDDATTEVQWIAVRHEPPATMAALYRWLHLNAPIIVRRLRWSGAPLLRAHAREVRRVGRHAEVAALYHRAQWHVARGEWSRAYDALVAIDYVTNDDDVYDTDDDDTTDTRCTLTPSHRRAVDALCRHVVHRNTVLQYATFPRRHRWDTSSTLMVCAQKARLRLVRDVAPLHWARREVTPLDDD